MTTQQTLRHALTAAAGIAIALVGAVATSGPAGAAAPLQTGGGHANKLSITASAGCDRTVGKWKVVWTITNGWNRDATIIDVKTDPQAAVTVGEPPVDLDGAVIPQKNQNTDGSITATELVGAAAGSATLAIEVDWNKVLGTDNDGTSKADATVHFEGSCTPTTRCVSAGDAHFTHTFNGPAGTATIKLAGDLPLCEGQSQKFLLVSYFAPSPRAEWPQYTFDTDVQAIDREHTQIDLAVDVPACFTQVDLVFGDELINPMVANGPRYGNRKLGSSGAPGNRSQGKPAWFNGGTSTCAIPAATMESDCNGAVTVHLSNGGDAHFAVPFKVTAGLSGPAFVKEVSVEPGQSKEVVVPAESADKITVTTDGDFLAEGMWKPGHCDLPTVAHKATCDSLTISVTNKAGNLPAEVTITYGAQVKHLTVEAGQTEEVTFTATDKTEATVDFPDFQKSVKVVYDRPGDCATPTPSPEPSTPSSPQPSTTPSPATPGLPVTGVQVGVFAGIGALLLAAGAVLLVGARRRRLTEVE